jgi:hypothetical protein
MARRQNIPNKWDTTLCDNFATIAVPFPCPPPTVDFVFPHIAITYDDPDILPGTKEKDKESKGYHHTLNLDAKS